MSSLNNSKVIDNSKSIYDITHKIEEELTYIYEMRMKQSINSSANRETESEEINPNKSNISNGNQIISLFAR